MTSFKLTQDHIKLLRHMYVEWHNCETGAPAINPKRPYGNSYVAGDVYEILTENDSDHLSEEQEQYYLEIHKQTLEALKVFLHNASITPGVYDVFDGWYDSLATQEYSTSTDKRIIDNEQFQHLVKTLKTKLVEKGWASEFKVNTLVKLIENHFSELVQTIPEKPQEDSTVTEDYLISEWFDVAAQKVYYSILNGTTKLLITNLPYKLESLDKAKEIVRNLRKYKNSIYHKVD
jgi:hypothetical protein